MRPRSCPGSIAPCMSTAGNCWARPKRSSAAQKTPPSAGNREGACVERDGGAAGLAGISDVVAARPSPAGGLDTERAGRGDYFEPGDRADEQRVDQRIREQPDAPDIGYLGVFRAVESESVAGTRRRAYGCPVPATCAPRFGCSAQRVSRHFTAVLLPQVLAGLHRGSVNGKYR
jgi:hypothetical protein